ncbi:vacuolar protein 8 [Dorcoceras hygrometricum]|nr:vacuolar protein 8 [Dorcoceras hygrometricum]
MGGEISPQETSTERPRQLQAIGLISSLIALSHSTKVFESKWISVRNKMEELLSILTTIENCETNDNFSLCITVESISATISECDGLLKRCLEFSYCGKLYMQSDLDIVSAKLDNHVKTLSDIYALGLVTQSYAIVVPKPGPSASKEDVRFYVHDISSRMKIGSTSMKKQALVEFNEAIQEDERYVKIAVEHESFVVAFGVIAPLIRVLESGNEPCQEFAARCLIKVTENSDNAWSVSAHGGVTALLKICGKKGENGGELANLACGVLKNLTGIEEIKRFMVDDGAIPLFLKLVRSKDEIVQIASLDFLQTMAYSDSSIREMMVEEGGIRILVRVMDPKSSFPAKTREMAFKGIMNLCLGSDTSLYVLMNSGFTDHVLYFLQFGEISVRELALKASLWLCGTSQDAKRVMGDAGFMPVLVSFLESKSFQIRELAAATLSNMVIVPKNRKKFVQNDQNVGILMQLLGPGEVNTCSKQLLLSILMSLTSSNTARKKISNSGYLKNIEKLAEAEVSDAKKIVRKLSSTTKFRSILGGLWHS